MARGRKRAERLDKEEIRSLIFVGVSMWAIFMVAIVCFWVAPKHFGNSEIGTGESNEEGTNVAVDSTNESSTEESTVEQTAPETTKLTELPAEWANATAKDYLQQMFLTTASSWGYQNGVTPTEIVTNELIHSKWGLPGGIWRQDGTNFLTEEMNILENYYHNTIVNGLYLTEVYETDVETLAQDLAAAGVHVNIIPDSVNLEELGVEALELFIETMHDNGISAGIYCDDVGVLKNYMELELDLDCIVVNSNLNASGYRPCMIDPEAARIFFDGAILMKACTDRMPSAQASKDLISEAVEAGCDSVSVCHLAGDSSARAIYAYGYFIEQDSVTYENNIARLQESVLRLLNLDRSLWTE